MNFQLFQTSNRKDIVQGDILPSLHRFMERNDDLPVLALIHPRCANKKIGEIFEKEGIELGVCSFVSPCDIYFPIGMRISQIQEMWPGSTVATIGNFLSGDLPVIKVSAWNPDTTEMDPEPIPVITNPDHITTIIGGRGSSAIHCSCGWKQEHIGNKGGKRL